MGQIDVDPIAGLVVSAMIGKAAVELAIDALKDLTDTSVSKPMLGAVSKILDESKVNHATLVYRDML